MFRFKLADVGVAPKLCLRKVRTVTPWYTMQLCEAGAPSENQCGFRPCFLNRFQNVDVATRSYSMLRCVVLDVQHAFLFLVQAVVSVHGVSVQEQLWSSNNFGRMPS
jgi:hypothetical protein